MKYTFLYTNAHFLVRQEKSHSFIYLDKIDKGPSDDELADRMGEDMAEGKEKDAKNAENILEMQRSLRDRISDSEFLPKDEKVKHLEFIKIRTLSGREIRDLDAKVTKEEKWVKGARESYADQINAAGDKVFAFDRKTKTDTKQEYLDEFNSLKSISEIKRYMEGLRAEIEEKIALWDNVMKLVEERYPDKAKEYEDKLRTWDRTERKQQLSVMEQLEGMDDNIPRYQEFLDSKEAQEHMSKDTRERYAKAFQQLTPNEQEFWIKESPKWLSQFEQQTKNFNEFSEGRRKEFKGFSEKGLTGKMEMIDEDNGNVI